MSLHRSECSLWAHLVKNPYQMESAWLTVGWSLLCGCLAESPKKSLSLKKKKNSWAPGLSTRDRDQSWPRDQSWASGPAQVSIYCRRTRGPAVVFFSFFFGANFFQGFRPGSHQGGFSPARQTPLGRDPLPNGVRWFTKWAQSVHPDLWRGMVWGTTDITRTPKV